MAAESFKQQGCLRQGRSLLLCLSILLLDSVSKDLFGKQRQGQNWREPTVVTRGRRPTEFWCIIQPWTRTWSSMISISRFIMMAYILFLLMKRRLFAILNRLPNWVLLPRFLQADCRWFIIHLLYGSVLYYQWSRCSKGRWLFEQGFFNEECWSWPLSQWCISSPSLLMF